MNTHKINAPVASSEINRPSATKRNLWHIPIKIAGKDISLNVGFHEAMARFVIALGLPMIMLLIDKRLIIYTVPVIAYLFISGITHFCILKYAWRRFVEHAPAPARPPYGGNINYPEESV